MKTKTFEKRIFFAISEKIKSLRFCKRVLKLSSLKLLNIAEIDIVAFARANI